MTPTMERTAGIGQGVNDARVPTSRRPVTSRRFALVDVDDSGPLGIREYPSCPFPREYQRYEIGRVGAIELPRSMTRREWEFLHTWLELTRETGLVVE